MFKTIQSPRVVGSFAAIGIAVGLLLSCSTRADEGVTSNRSNYVKPSVKELRDRLSPIAFKVTQRDGTEPAFRNAYWDNKEKGQYHCVVCDLPLFTDQTKYKSGTGWPSFYAPVDEDAVGTQTDYKMIYPRTEVHCSRCEAHLGHVFNDGPAPTGLRYCMNSAAMQFKPQPTGGDESKANASSEAKDSDRTEAADEADDKAANEAANKAIDESA